MRTVVSTPTFKKSYKKAQKRRQKDLPLLLEVINTLREHPDISMYANHKLKGSMAGYSACHIKPNWVLVYKATDTELQLVDLGNHDEVYRR